MTLLTIAVSSRALFHIEDGNDIFESQGQDAFDEYMRSKETTPLKPGAAFPLVKKLLALNTAQGMGRDRVQVVLLSRNSAQASLRIMNSVQHYGLDIERGVFTSGTDRFRYAQALGAHLFLSATHADVESALKRGMAAATLLPREHSEMADDDVVRIAFDGDAVIFGTEADETYRTKGLAAFRSSELDFADVPLAAGPLKGLLEQLTALQLVMRDAQDTRLRIGMVTARGIPSHARPILTLRHWGLQVDETVFAAGVAKGPLLVAFGADMFFDDAMKNIQSARSCDVPSGHVPFGAGAGLYASEEAALTAVTD